jgi:CDP-glycerol glycerophosphotransferase (TagB/SpsB family)
MLPSLLNLLNRLIPKKGERIIISSFPDFDDMTRAILEKESVIVLLGQKRSKKPKWLPSNVRFFYKYSLKGLWLFLTASKIYYTHGMYRGFKKVSESKQLVINLWHGMPLKKIGLLDGKGVICDAHYVYCSSEFFAPVICSSFGIWRDQLIIDTLPRNRILLRQSDNNYLSSLTAKYERIIVWLPTYRKSNAGDIRSDGSSENSSVFGFEGLDSEKLDLILANKNNLVIVKPHPMAVFTSTNMTLKNIKVIDESWLYAKGVTLYELLSISDELWTDFSSVYVDYELTGKKILFTATDLEEMKLGRGLNFDIDEINLPGPLVQTNFELLDYIRN